MNNVEVGKNTALRTTSVARAEETRGAELDHQRWTSSGQNHHYDEAKGIYIGARTRKSSPTCCGAKFQIDPAKGPHMGGIGERLNLV